MFSLSLLISWSGAFLCFLPAFLGLSLDVSGYDSENSIPIRTSMSSKSFEYSLVASIAISIPLIFEQGVDSILINFNKSGSTYTYENVVLWKWILLIALLVPNIILLLFLSATEDCIYIPIIFSSRQIILFHILFSFLGTYGFPIWNPLTANICCILFTSGQILESYSAFVSISSPINPIKYGLNILCTLIIIWTAIRWLLHIKERLNSKLQGLTMNEYYCNVHLLAMGIAVGGLWYLSLSYTSTSWAGAPEPLLYMYAYIEIAYTVLLTVWNGRLARWEMAQTRTELETKRMFVRYVSHEIRTPLNTVGMGLQLLRTELAKIHENEMMLDIVQDLSVSCDTAVDILDDLLTYEKLAANILHLDGMLISSKMFILDVIRPFYMQARQAGIELLVEFVGDLREETVDVNIFGDKNKLSQVIRNLVSNALKFTQRNGKVTVSLSTTSALSFEISDCFHSHDGVLELVQSESLTSLQSANDLHGAGVRTDQIIRQNDSENPVDMDPLGLMQGSRANQGMSDSRHTQMKWLKIDVADSGPGISEENQKRLFKEIVQFNPGELQDGKGSGLGLWISSRIMELHGGDLTVISEGVGHGCTFTLTVPIREVVILSNSEQKTSHMPFSSNCSSTSPNILPFINGINPSYSPLDLVVRSRVNSITEEMSVSVRLERSLQSEGSPSDVRKDGGLVKKISLSRVLLVDDVAMNRKMLNRLLKDRCGTISEAEDGKQALDMVLAALRDPSLVCIDAVIIDFQMPVMDGPTAVREMRSAGYRGIVIGLTGNALPSDIEFFLSRGADRVMIKPCNMSELDNILRDLTTA